MSRFGDELKQSVDMNAPSLLGAQSRPLILYFGAFCCYCYLLRRSQLHSPRSPLQPQAFVMLVVLQVYLQAAGLSLALAGLPNLAR